MSTLTEASFSALIEKGCVCGGTTWNIASYVEGRVPVLEGETFGAMVWAYKGETFVDGIFEIVCASCKQAAFSDSICPRCHAGEGLERALTSENTLSVPKACPGCRGKQVGFVGFVPARVHYVGKRAEKARNTTAIEDEGFHGVRVECKACLHVTERELTSCPLCAAPGPLRKRCSG